MRRIVGACVVLVVALLGGCASAGRESPVRMPSPAPGDIEGQIMSVTGTGFTLCSIDDGGANGVTTYDVQVCGSMDRAQAALDADLPSLAPTIHLRPYQPDDGGTHTPQSLVMQFWVDRTTGPGFTVVESQIMPDGTIDVGIEGDMSAGKAALNKEFPGWVTFHAATGGVELVGRNPALSSAPPR